jgi:two-component system chemotaxis response regulator CheY
MEPERRRVRILVVDDAAFMRKQLRDILEGAGHDVVAEGEDGDAALRLYETHEPELVTLDMVMPRRGGIEALKELRARHPEARVIVCSSVSDEPTILEAISLGARDYVLKPVSSAKLLEAVQKAVGEKG